MSRAKEFLNILEVDMTAFKEDDYDGYSGVTGQAYISKEKLTIKGIRGKEVEADVIVDETGIGIEGLTNDNQSVSFFKKMPQQDALEFAKHINKEIHVSVILHMGFKRTL